jgi:hypothetical protein
MYKLRAKATPQSRGSWCTRTSAPAGRRSGRSRRTATGIAISMCATGRFGERQGRSRGGPGSRAAPAPLRRSGPSGRLLSARAAASYSPGVPRRPGRSRRARAPTMTAVPLLCRSAFPPSVPQTGPNGPTVYTYSPIFQKIASLPMYSPRATRVPQRTGACARVLAPFRVPGTAPWSTARAVHNDQREGGVARTNAMMASRQAEGYGGASVAASGRARRPGGPASCGRKPALFRLATRRTRRRSVQSKRAEPTPNRLEPEPCEELPSRTATAPQGPKRPVCPPTAPPAGLQVTTSIRGGCGRFAAFCGNCPTTEPEQPSNGQTCESASKHTLLLVYCGHRRVGPEGR